MESLKGRSLLTLKDFNSSELRFLIDLSHRVKKQKGEVHERFKGKSLALIFEKRSTRTRCAFETAFGEEGGNTSFLSTQDIHLGEKESIEDTARVLGRMYDCIQFRGFEQRKAEVLAEYSGIPVYNGLTDSYHPTQVLADLMTMEEYSGSLAGDRLVYVGDGRNNVARSLIIGCSLMEVTLTIVAPKELLPKEESLESLSDQKPRITLTSDIERGVLDADFIYTDVWASMGEEKMVQKRERLLSDFQVDNKMMEKTGNPKVRFLHCLPAVKGKEVTSEVIDGPTSLVWDQAENRKHTIKALMMPTMP